MKLYVVTITRLVVCEDERQAREIAAQADNPEDVDQVVEAGALSDITEAWREFCPWLPRTQPLYGEGDGSIRNAAEWWHHLHGHEEAP